VHYDDSYSSTANGERKNDRSSGEALFFFAARTRRAFGTPSACVTSAVRARTRAPDARAIHEILYNYDIPAKSNISSLI